MQVGEDSVLFSVFTTGPDEGVPAEIGAILEQAAAMCGAMGQPCQSIPAEKALAPLSLDELRRSYSHLLANPSPSAS
jgi:hypothetical protein